MSNMPQVSNVLLWPVRKVWISADCEDHGYPADDLGWWDYDPEMPNDSGKNAQIYAMANGIVTQIVNSHPDEPDWEGYGNYIVIEYPAINMWSLCGHIKKNSFLVKIGDQVTQGQPVARMGNSGYSYGNHDHLETGYGHFVRHGGVDPTKVVYATEWHIVDDDTQEEYNILHVTIMPTDRDVTKNQVNVFGKDLRIRTAPVDGKVVGFAPVGYYDYTESTEGDGYTWCHVGDYWIAGDTDVSEICEASFVPVEPNPMVNQVEVTIDDLRIRLEPSTSSTIMGFCPVGYFDVEESRSEEDYVWFRVYDYWIAFVEGCIYHGSQEDPKDKEIAELKAEIELLHEAMDEQKMKIEYQEGIIKGLNEQIETNEKIIRQQIDDFTEIRYLASKNIPE